MMPRWHLLSSRIDEYVYAPDQHMAWDTLRDQPVECFGLIVTAEQNEDDNPVAVHSTQLLFKWHRDDDAYLLLHAAMLAGLPNTKEADMRAAGRL